MILGYGSYRSAQDECEISFERTKTYAPGTAVVESIMERWTIEGEVQGATPAAVVAAYLALEAAYSVDGRDAVLFFNDGVTVAHAMYAARSLSGIRVVQPPHYPRGDGTELHNARNYRIVLEGEFLPSGPERDMLAFDESVTVEGGGPELVVVPLIKGFPQIQVLYENTEVVATQQGSAVGRLRYPPRPQPLWPALEWRRRRRVTRHNPRLRSVTPQLVWTEYRIEWSYTFLSTSELIGIPNRQF